jgi:hypothetical protein
MEEKILQALQAMREDFSKRFDSLETQVKENTDILKALEHSAQVNRAEHDRMSNDIAHIKGEFEALRKDMANVEIITSSNWNEIAKLKAVK